MKFQKITSRGIIGRFFNRLEQAEGMTWIDPLSMYVTSNQLSEEYGWLGMSPAMREWVGGRQAKGLREEAFAIRNKKYEATLEVNTDDLRRDHTGQLMIRVDEMADKAAVHWNSLLTALIIAGESTDCYDGQYFFDTDHSEGSSGTQTNDISVDISALPVGSAFHGSTTAPAVEELNLAIMQGVRKILGFKDDQGDPMNELAREFTIMVPLPFWETAAAALGNKMLANSRDNTIQNLSGMRFNLIVNPRLTWTTKFAVFRTDGTTKPFIRQEEVPIQVDAIAEGSELEFNEHKHHYGIWASRAVGYGYWQHACLVTLT